MDGRDPRPAAQAGGARGAGRRDPRPAARAGGARAGRGGAVRARAGVAAAAALAWSAIGPAPARADSEMRQSPLLMRRAGPSCQPGDLGAEPGAGYRYRLGPCAGPDAPAAAGRSDPAPPAPRRGRRALGR